MSPPGSGTDGYERYKVVKIVAAESLMEAEVIGWKERLKAHQCSQPDKSISQLHPMLRMW